MDATWVFLTKTAKSQFVSINSDLSPALRRPTVGCLRDPPGTIERVTCWPYAHKMMTIEA